MPRVSQNAQQVPAHQARRPRNRDVHRRFAPSSIIVDRIPKWSPAGTMNLRMRAWNRAKLLWGYLARRSRLPALPVEYIVETTAKCNLYCPMCPRETHKQPKADMSEAVFGRLVHEAGRTAEHMMLIGLGEPFMDPHIFPRIEFCHQHSISTLLSTNGTF